MRVWMIDLVLTTMTAQLPRSTEAGRLMLNCIFDIAKGVVARAPSHILIDESIVDWLEIEIDCEEFSLCEDVLDGSSN